MWIIQKNIPFHWRRSSKMPDKHAHTHTHITEKNHIIHTYVLHYFYAYSDFEAFIVSELKTVGRWVCRIQELEEQNALLQRSFGERGRSSKLRDKHRQQDGFFGPHMLHDSLYIFFAFYILGRHVLNGFSFCYVVFFGGPNWSKWTNGHEELEAILIYHPCFQKSLFFCVNDYLLQLLP